MTRKVYQVPYLTGYTEDGTGEVMLDVIYMAHDFLRGPDGLCAFCHGDSVDEKQAGHIHEYFELYKADWGHYPETCPLCDGRPS